MPLTPEQSRVQQQLRPLVLATMDRVGGYETSKGWLRYEAMRKLNLQQLSAMQTRNLKGERWDDMLDALIAERGGVE